MDVIDFKVYQLMAQGQRHLSPKAQKQAVDSYAEVTLQFVNRTGSTIGIIGLELFHPESGLRRPMRDLLTRIETQKADITWAFDSEHHIRPRDLVSIDTTPRTRSAFFSLGPLTETFLLNEPMQLVVEHTAGQVIATLPKPNQIIH